MGMTFRPALVTRKSHTMGMGELLSHVRSDDDGTEPAEPGTTIRPERRKSKTLTRKESLKAMSEAMAQEGSAAGGAAVRRVSLRRASLKAHAMKGLTRLDGRRRSSTLHMDGDHGAASDMRRASAAFAAQQRGEQRSMHDAMARADRRDRERRDKAISKKFQQASQQQ